MNAEKGYVDSEYLETAARVLLPVKQRSHQLLALQGGDRVLDVGCGPGIDVVMLAKQVGAGGQAVGVDADSEMIAAAGTRAQQLGLADIVSFEQGDATELPFPDESFDAARGERLLMHLREPTRAISELARVTKPGGRVVLVDMDWGTLSIASKHLDTERALARLLAERCLENGYSGRNLYGQVSASGLEDASAESISLHLTDYQLARYICQLDKVEQVALESGGLGAEALQRWRDELAEAHAGGRFFGSASIVLVAARKAG